MELPISVKDVSTLEKNVKEGVKCLQENMAKLIKIHSAFSINSHYISDDLFRSVMMDEVKEMHQGVKSELDKFKRKLDKAFCSSGEKQCNEFNGDYKTTEVNKNVKQEHVIELTFPENVNVLNNSDINDGEYILEPTIDNEVADIHNIFNEKFVDKLNSHTMSNSYSGDSSDESDDNFSRIKFIKKHKCTECSKAFSTNKGLQWHRSKRHNLKGTNCPICFRKFSSTSLMDEHYRTHTGEKPFKCDTCGKTFGRKKSFQVHQLVHSQHRPFICEVCGKSFRSKQEVASHKMSHIGERTFICAICGKGFVRPQNLTQHVKTHDENRSKKRKRKN